MTYASSNRLHTPALFTLLVGLLGLGPLGCADLPQADEGEYAADPARVSVHTAALATADLRDPTGSYFASIKANGTGCPSGSWNTEISKDGKTFTTTFSSYEANVEKGSKVSVKDCQLTIALHSPSGLSFAVQEFTYAGYAYLDKGVQARLIANYYFQGAPGENAEVRTELKGPHDDTFEFSDTLKNADLVYAPCGVDRTLNVRTTLRVLNGDPEGSGYANFAAVDGNTELKLKLAWKKCDAGKGKDEKPDEEEKEEEEEEEKEPSKPAKPSTPAKPEKPKPSTPAKPEKPAKPDWDAIFDDLLGGGGPTVIGVDRK